MAIDGDLYSASFDAAWELDIFGGVRRASEAAKAYLEGQDASLANVEVSLAAETAQAYVQLRAARLLAYQAAWNADLGRNVAVDASVAKMYGTEAACQVLDRCMQIHGALGLADELPLERWFRDLRVKRLGEGATEIQREVVARAMLK